VHGEVAIRPVAGVRNATGGRSAGETCRGTQQGRRLREKVDREDRLVGRIRQKILTDIWVDIADIEPIQRALSRRLHCSHNGECLVSVAVIVPLRGRNAWQAKQPGCNSEVGNALRSSFVSAYVGNN